VSSGNRSPKGGGAGKSRKKEKEKTEGGQKRPAPFIERKRGKGGPQPHKGSYGSPEGGEKKDTWKGEKGKAVPHESCKSTLALGK